VGVLFWTKRRDSEEENPPIQKPLTLFSFSFRLVFFKPKHAQKREISQGGGVHHIKVNEKERKGQKERGGWFSKSTMIKLKLSYHVCMPNCSQAEVCEWVMSHLTESRHVWRIHVTYEWVTSRSVCPTHLSPMALKLRSLCVYVCVRARVFVCVHVCFTAVARMSVLETEFGRVWGYVRCPRVESHTRPHIPSAYRSLWLRLSLCYQIRSGKICGFLFLAINYLLW